MSAGAKIAYRPIGLLGGIAAGVALSSGSGSSLPPTDLGSMRFY